MALTDYSLKRATQTNERLLMPGAFPELPNEVVKRFPEAAAYNESARNFWGKVKRSLVDSYAEVAQPQNDLKSSLGSLEKTLKTDTAELSARIKEEKEIRVSQDEALAMQVNLIDASYSGGLTTAYAAIMAEQVARVNADSALATRTTTLESTVNTASTGLTARIGVIETTYATKDFATAKKEEAINAAVTSANSYTSGQISTLSSVYATPTYVETKKTEAINAAVTSANSYTSGQISTLSSVYATPTYVETKKTEAINAAVTSANSYTSGQISALSSVYATPAAVDAKVTTAITAEVGARNSAISASVATESAARATADGFLSSKYTLSVTAGDVVTGMNITSSTSDGSTVSTFIIQADVFRIYNGAGGIAPFTVSGGTVYAQNLVVDGSLVASGSISTSRLNFTPVQTSNVVASINASAEGIQISGAKIQISGSTTFAAGYNPSAKIDNGNAAYDINNNTTTINGGKITTGSISTSRLDFTPVQTSNVVASINASAEGIQISGAKVQINGTTTFASGYNPSTKLDSGSAAADINNNNTTINGSKISTGYLSAISANLGDITSGSLDLTTAGYRVRLDGQGITLGYGGIYMEANTSASAIFIGSGGARITLGSVVGVGQIGFQGGRSIDYWGNMNMGDISCSSISTGGISCNSISTSGASFAGTVDTPNSATLNLGNFRIGCGRSPSAGDFVGYLTLVAFDGTTLNVPFYS